MNAKNIAILQILIALITALIMILLTALTNYDSQQITYWILAIWFIPFSYLNILSARLEKKK
jgi:uncharacterized integral membrane protein